MTQVYLLSKDFLLPPAPDWVSSEGIVHTVFLKKCILKCSISSPWGANRCYLSLGVSAFY